MKQTRSILMIIAVAFFALASCKKDLPNNYGSVNPPGSTSSVIAKIYGDLKSAPQTLTVTAGVQQTVFGTKKTKLTFYPNSFKDKNGNTITSGTITIKLVEIYKPGGMIANNAPTISNGKWLTSGGEVNIRAFRNGEEVYANKYGIGFAQSAASSQPMQLFYGNNNNVDSSVTWTPAANTTGTTTGGTTIDSIGNQDIYYEFDSCANFSWINCDYFYNAPGPLTGVDAVMPGASFNSTNTMVMIIFPSINSAASFNTYNSGNNTFSISSNYYVPVGMTVHFVSITNDNGNYYYYQLLNQTVTNSMSVNLSPQPQTQAYIQNALSQL